MVDEHHTKERAANIFGDFVTIDNDTFQSAERKSAVFVIRREMDKYTLSREDDHDSWASLNRTLTCIDELNSSDSQLRSSWTYSLSTDNGNVWRSHAFHRSSTDEDLHPDHPTRQLIRRRDHSQFSSRAEQRHLLSCKKPNFTSGVK